MYSLFLFPADLMNSIILEHSYKILYVFLYTVRWANVGTILISLKTNIYVCFTYIPPRDSKYYKIAEMDPFETLESGIRRYSDLGEILVLGDLNARSADWKDIAMDTDIFDKYIDSLNGIDMFCSVQQLLPRASMDKEVNTSGEKLLDLCKSSNLMICDGRMFDEADVGHFTFMSEKGCSLIDYALVTPNLGSQISVLVSMSFFITHHTVR